MNIWDKLRSFSTLYEKMTAPVRERYHLTQMEFDIVMFLHNAPCYKTANDMVRVRHLTKSHVSASVASLEKSGLLERSIAEGDRRRICLKLTPAAEEVVSAGKAAQAAYGDALTEGFSQAEKDQFRELFLRMCANADAEIVRRA